MSLFDIDDDQIPQLNDTDLRSLILRLCEADLSRAGLPVSAVTAGGDQNAADGGLDVHVELSDSAHSTGFIPRTNTGYQVKVPDMPRGKILEEMCPSGGLRQVIKDLIDLSGAYVIVSSNGSTSDGALRRRRDAMNEAVRSFPGSGNLLIDFYDRTRIATWLRTHPGLIPWVRERIGQPASGWRPYGKWSHDTAGSLSEYLIDPKARLLDFSSPRKDNLSIESGLSRVREILGRPKGIVRLVGLSGTGKTSFAQALFDKRLGKESLDSALAFYADLGDEPRPTPRDVARRLATTGERAILVVDNCPPEAHNAIASVCSEMSSSFSVLTIEYDVGEDQPESTDVFRLDIASDEIIDQLLQHRAPHLSYLERRRIAEVSSGNTRVALALSQAVKRGDNIASMNDRVLFSKLFLQRNAVNIDLERSAEVTSLVYSFDGGGTDMAEISFLSELAGLDIYPHVAELRSRELIQCRGPWRALMPHALANRLARQALERLPPTSLGERVFNEAPPRLLRSFSRRLGFLHDSEAARRIVGMWLEPGAHLGDVAALAPLGIEILCYVAPVAPHAILDALDRSIGKETDAVIVRTDYRAKWNVINLLRSIAYDPDLFERSAGLLGKFLEAEPEGWNHNSAQGPFSELFHIVLSGTRASVDQRLGAIRPLLTAPTERGRQAGLLALREMLAASHFSSSNGFQFGSLLRDYGWEPRSRNETVGWYRAILTFIEKGVQSGELSVDEARSIVAIRFRELWQQEGVDVELDRFARKLALSGFWQEGWIATRKTIRLDRKEISEESLERLRELEIELKPKALRETVAAYVFTKAWGALDLPSAESIEPEVGRSGDRVAQQIEKLGEDAVQNSEILNELLHDLLTTKVGQSWSFGRGLARACSDLGEMWATLVSAFSDVEPCLRDAGLLRGFLSGAAERDESSATTLMDRAVGHPVLGELFPILQTSVEIGLVGAHRLLMAIRGGLAPTWTYRHLAFGRVSDSIPANMLCEIVLSLAELEGGYDAAIELYDMYLFARQSESDLSDDLSDVGRKLLLRCRFDRADTMLDHHMAKLSERCLVGDDSREAARLLCTLMLDGIANGTAHIYDYREFILALFSNQAQICMDVILLSGEKLVQEFFDDFDAAARHPLEAVASDELLAWVDVDPNVHLKIVAPILPLFVKDKDSVRVQPLIAHFLDREGDKRLILPLLDRNIVPTTYWVDSLSVELDRRCSAIGEFASHEDPEVSDWAKRCLRRLQEIIRAERSIAARRDETFE